MINKASDKPSPLDWVGCIPGVGTAVGLVETVYNFALLLITEFSESRVPNKPLQTTDDTAKSASARPNLANLTKQTEKLQTHAQKFLEVTQQLKEAAEEREKKADLIAKKCFAGMLRMTWIGGIGICVYKLLKKPSTPPPT